MDDHFVFFGLFVGALRLLRLVDDCTLTFEDVEFQLF